MTSAAAGHADCGRRRRAPTASCRAPRGQRPAPGLRGSGCRVGGAAGFGDRTGAHRRPELDAASRGRPTAALTDEGRGARAALGGEGPAARGATAGGQSSESATDWSATSLHWTRIRASLRETERSTMPSRAAMSRFS